MLTEDLITSCKDNNERLNEITKTFGCKDEHLQSTNFREKRQIIAIGIAIASIISIYSISQLTKMVTSNDDELITTTNHIINAIEDHENRITRSEEDTKRLMMHVKELEKELFILNDFQLTTARILSIKTQALSIKNHVETIENGLYNLIRGQITPYLVNIDTLQKGLDEPRDSVTKNGYRLSVFGASEAFQLDSSFVSLTNGTIICLLHIPIYKTQAALQLYEYILIPLITNQNSTLMIEPSKKLIAFSMKQDLYIELDNIQLLHKCKFIKSTYFCENNAVLMKSTKASCLQTLYLNQVSKIGSTCPVKLYNEPEFVTQLNSTSFFIYSSLRNQVFVTCANEAGLKIYEKSYEVLGFAYLHIFKNCDVTLKGHIITAALPVKMDISTQIRSIKIDLKELVNLGKNEIEGFTKFIKKELKPETQPIHLTTVKEKYDLHVISRSRSIFSKEISAISGLFGLLIVAIITTSAFKMWKNTTKLISLI